MSMAKEPKTIMKFGYLWLFRQPELDEYAKIILPMLSETERLVNEYLAKEGVKNEQVGYRPEMMQIMLQMNPDFSIYQR